ncbi:Proteinase inhibitor I33, aspin domain-containing protein [Aphelenchoides bicaudatus]|nr:Proteinase inhibitor I33, aspin domain-containing protein [Aphelenchoides bicaudatus]
MKTLILLCVTVAVVFGQPVKRFAGFGLSSLSTVGGNLGCVVTGNKLFVNGLEGRDLTSDEQEELKEYEGKLKTFRQELKQILEERRAELEERRRSGDRSSALENQTARKTPEAPKKPSFCSEQATTQYIFDGCKVQNNNLYVGSTFARKLNDQEIEELKQFDKEMTVYQKSISSNLEQQLNDLFSGAFSGRTQASKPTEKAAASDYWRNSR